MAKLDLALWGKKSQSLKNELEEGSNEEATATLPKKGMIAVSRIQI